MKRIITLILTLAMLLSLCSCKKGGGGSVSKEQVSLNYPEYADAETYSAADSAAKYNGKEPWQPMTWTLVCDGGDSSTAAEAGRYFNALMQYSTGGKVTVNVSTTQDGEGALQKLMYGDEVQLSIQSSLTYAAFDPRLGVASLPFLFPSLETAEETLNGRAGKQLKEILPELGMMCIGIGSYGFHQLMSAAPVEVPAGLSDMTVSVSNDLQREFAASLMNTVPEPDTASAVCAPLFDLSRQPYLYLWNFSYEPVFFCINQNLFSQLTDEQKKVITDNGAKAASYQRHIQRERNAELVETWREEGTVEVVEYEAVDIAAMKDAADAEGGYRQRLVNEMGLKEEEAEEFVEYFHIE